MASSNRSADCFSTCPCSVHLVCKYQGLLLAPWLTLSFQLPESPRWSVAYFEQNWPNYSSSDRLIKANRPQEALEVISALDDKPTSDAEVQRTYHAIMESVAIEERKNSDKPGSSSLAELFTGGRSQNFRRASLGVVIQCFQQVKVFVLCKWRHRIE